MNLPINSFLQGGKYKIIRFINSGGFGCTYEAEHVMLKKRIAIKEFFVKDFCNRDETTAHVTVGTLSKKGLVEKLRRKFIDEARILCHLQHPGIVRVSDVFEENGTAYFVMDYIGGCSLSEIVNREGPLSEHRALKYIRQVGEALQYVHDHNRLHLDVKPSNIMVDADGHTVLIDFGASKQYDEEDGENTSTLLGKTPGYAPLEQMGNNIIKFMPATDIYALGATLYKLLTGITPLSANLLASGEMLVPLPSTVSVSTCEAIFSAMQLNKNKRPQTVQEFFSLLTSASSSSEETIYNSQTELNDCVNLEKDGISIFYYDARLNSLIVCNAGSMFHIGFDEDLLLLKNRQVQINSSLVADFNNRFHFFYDSLSEHISKLCLTNEITRFGRFIVAYDNSISYCDILRYVIKIFGTIPTNVRIVKRTHLAVFYCGVNSMVYGIGDESKYTLIKRGAQNCIIEASEGVVEILGNECEGVISSTRILDSQSFQEIIAGAMILYKIWQDDANYPYIMLDCISFDLAIGIFEDEQELVICKNTNIPCKRWVEIEKGYADKLYIKIAKEMFVYPIDKCFKDDISIVVTIDIDADGILKFEVSSENHAKCDIITMSRLITYSS